MKKLIALAVAALPMAAMADVIGEIMGMKQQPSGIRVGRYHAGMGNDARRQSQRAFIDDDIQVMVATNAFGMGIDKADIRNVVHFDLPKSIENYSQEIGRAGRDGLPSRCMVLASRAQLPVLENFVYGDTPDRDAILSLLQILQQSLLIGGWVAMWRPLEIFLYDWWPVRNDRELMARLARMRVRLELPKA